MGVKEFEHQGVWDQELGSREFQGHEDGGQEVWRSGRLRVR